MANEPVCVRRAYTLEEASIIVAWLAEQGIEAKIADPGNPGVMAFGITDTEGIEVYVKDQATADEALSLLKAHQEQHGQDVVGPEIEMTCDSCGRQLHFPAGAKGTTQECPECGAHVDVGAG